MPGAGRRDALFSPLESSLEVRIDAVPGGLLVALSRAGQTFRGKCHTFIERGRYLGHVGVEARQACLFRRSIGVTWKCLTESDNRKDRSIFVLHLSLLRLLHEDAHKIHQVSIWWCANPKEPYTVHIFQN
jgi:hypothetical protein